MEKGQACGYIFEYVIGELLKESGYINVEENKIRGRGADHQIDAYGIYSFPTAFVYPIRLISEVKCYSDRKIGLPKIRNFVGVIKDISENYVINGNETGGQCIRYTDCGCFFSNTEFTKEAQTYAWAQNIFLVSFSRIEKMGKIINAIENFVDTLKIKKNNRSRINLNKEELIEAFKKRKSSNLQRNEVYEAISSTSLKVGILDNVYPVILVGNKDWDKEIHIPENSDKISGVKVERHDTDYGSNFKLFIEKTPVIFNLPKYVSSIIVSRVNNSLNDDPIFSLDIPIIIKDKDEKENIVRRILKVEVKLPKK